MADPCASVSPQIHSSSVAGRFCAGDRATGGGLDLCHVFGRPAGRTGDGSAGFVVITRQSIHGGSYLTDSV